MSDTLQDVNKKMLGDFGKMGKTFKEAAKAIKGVGMDERVINEEGGMKDDKFKLDWNLMKWQALIPVVKVLMFGRDKYSADNWIKVEAWRYERALKSHVIKDTYEEFDDETGLPHLAHAICCALFLIFIRYVKGKRSHQAHDGWKQGKRFNNPTEVNDE